MAVKAGRERDGCESEYGVDHQREPGDAGLPLAVCKRYPRAGPSDLVMDYFYRM